MGVDGEGKLVPMTGLEEAKSESEDEAESDKDNWNMTTSLIHFIDLVL